MDKHLAFDVKLSAKELTFLYRLTGHHLLPQSREDKCLIGSIFTQLANIAEKHELANPIPLNLSECVVAKGEHNSDRFLININ